MFTEKDTKALGLNWRRDLYKQSKVCITVLYLPYSTDSPAIKVCRTILSWFVDIQEDSKNLEVIEGGSWSELACIYYNIVLPSATLSGLAN